MDPVSTADTAATTLNIIAPSSLSFWDLFWQAGLFVKGVMLFLLGMSVMTWAILFTELRRLRLLSKRADRFDEAYQTDENLPDLYRNTDPADADHPMARLYAVGLREWDAAKDGGPDGNILQVGVAERVRQFMQVQLNKDADVLERNVPVLATIGSSAPFIGLLGTVWGIMHSFQSIGATKNTSLAVVAPGIAEALLATALGLFAAIPAVWAYNKLATALTRYTNRLDDFITEYSNRLEEGRQKHVITQRKTRRRRTGDFIQKKAS